MPAFSLTPVNAFPQLDGTEFPNPLAFAQDDVLFTGPITLVNFIGGTVTEDGNGTLDVTLGGGGGGYTAGANIDFTGAGDTIINAIPTSGAGLKAFQFDNSGAFGATVGLVSGELFVLSWTPQTTLFNQPSMGLQSTLNVATVGNVVYTADIKPAFGAWADDGSSDGTQMRATIGANTGSWTSYLPETFTLPRAGVWVSGPETHGGSPSYDAWMISTGLLFQARTTVVDPPNFDYVAINPHVQAGAAIAVPAETFNDGFQVIINGTQYWVPLIAA